MSAPILSFLSLQGRVGQTSLIYHLACMFADLDVTVLAVDLDPQAALTLALAPDWDPPRTFSIGPSGIQDLQPLRLADRLQLVPGDLWLASLEDALAKSWFLPDSDPSQEVTTAIHRSISQAVAACDADVVLIDLGSNLGGLNRAALVASDHIVSPLGSSRRAITLLGETLREWRAGWQTRRDASSHHLPPGAMSHLGYVLCRSRPGHVLRERFIESDYRAHLAGPPEPLGRMTFYPSLMDMAREAGKPMFHLKPADGVLGSHQQAIRQAAEEFRTLAQNIRLRAGF